jgi:hypothetical protein
MILILKYLFRTGRFVIEPAQTKYISSTRAMGVNTHVFYKKFDYIECTGTAICPAITTESF